MNKSNQQGIRMVEDQLSQLEHDLEQSSKRYVAMTQRLQTSVKEAEMNRAKAAAFNDLEKQCKEAQTAEGQNQYQETILVERQEQRMIQLVHGFQDFMKI